MIFWVLLIKLVPLYLLILLGYIGGKYIGIQRESIAKILIFILMPGVVLYATLRAQLNISLVLLPILIITLGGIIAALFKEMGSRLWKDGPRAHLLGYVSGVGNTGYFGLPAAISMFGESALVPAALVMLGSSIYHTSIGYFTLSRGKSTVWESLKKIFRLPAIYAFFVGIFLQLVPLEMEKVLGSVLDMFRVSYSFLGMMIIGISLSKITKASIDKTFVALTFAAKFLVWPLALGLVVIVDQQYIGVFDSLTHKVLILMSAVPLSGITVTFATELRAHPEKAAVAVFLSTVVALVYMPLLVSLFL